MATRSSLVPSATPVRTSPISRVVRVTAGNALEMYDFQVFGYYAAAIAVTFCPSGNEFASLMLSLSVAYSLATAVFGGFTPAISTYLIHVTGNPAMPGVWLSFAANCGLIAAVVLSRRTRITIPLESVS